ncbi:winged helix-turn-helix domain-containing protein [Parabacteroides pacaensis]|uniref:winged helix-turn-helix domain-containing protein n=1 Tax=Parabacteroides pacaensis TaxID=2086575 RepID=UPI000D1109E6|nr:winged helix-turn-helix domain-containing protein [Parabacteroides pacaensis]
MIAKIGTNAGLVWKALNEGGKMNVKQVKKATKLVDKDLYAAFGWLAKENKVAFEEVDGNLFVSLIESC